MRRIIVDYKKLTPEILSMLVDKYPDGYDDDHVITFKNAKNETVEAVEVRTDDTIYLVKVSSRLESTMANFEEDDYDDSDFNEPIVEIPEKKNLEDDEIEDDEDLEEEED
ncbi:MAG: hypothetical protein CMC08_06540 [Flavobacteriaceae bacterium]|nr:hypothetical protein [Flavobacteriaceae bacterium]